MGKKQANMDPDAVAGDHRPAPASTPAADNGTGTGTGTDTATVTAVCAKAVYKAECRTPFASLANSWRQISVNYYLHAAPSASNSTSTSSTSTSTSAAAAAASHPSRRCPPALRLCREAHAAPGSLLQGWCETPLLLLSPPRRRPITGPAERPLRPDVKRPPYSYIPFCKP